MSEGKYFGLANAMASANAGGTITGAQQANSAPPSPSITSAVERIDFSINRARDIRDVLEALAARLDPNLVSAPGKADKPLPAGLISVAHSRHEDLESLLNEVFALVRRVSAAIG